MISTTMYWGLFWVPCVEPARFRATVSRDQIGITPSSAGAFREQLRCPVTRMAENCVTRCSWPAWPGTMNGDSGGRAFSRGLGKDGTLSCAYAGLPVAGLPSCGLLQWLACPFA